MTPEELAAVRGRLEEFAVEVFAPLARSDQRSKGQTYLRGLLLDGRRKSMQPMAERLGVDHQGLQQFVSSSTWAVEPVRKRLARRAVAGVAPEAWGGGERPRGGGPPRLPPPMCGPTRRGGWRGRCSTSWPAGGCARRW